MVYRTDDHHSNIRSIQKINKINKLDEIIAIIIDINHKQFVY